MIMEEYTHSSDVVRLVKETNAYRALQGLFSQRSKSISSIKFEQFYTETAAQPFLHHYLYML